MIIDWTSGAIQQLPTVAGGSVWNWSGVSAVAAATVSYIFTAAARSATDTAAARSATHTASTRSATHTAEAANRMNQ